MGQRLFVTALRGTAAPAKTHEHRSPRLYDLPHRGSGTRQKLRRKQQRSGPQGRSGNVLPLRPILRDLSRRRPIHLRGRIIPDTHPRKRNDIGLQCHCAHERHVATSHTHCLRVSPFFYYYYTKHVVTKN